MSRTPEQQEALRTIRNRDRKRLRELKRALREEERQIQQGLRRRPTMTIAKGHHEVVALLKSTSTEAKLPEAAERGGATRRCPPHMHSGKQNGAGTDGADEHFDQYLKSDILDVAQRCPPSALMRQIGWVEEGRISGSS
jgi:hypothetical protein